jgi:hypothetical protein
MGIDDVGYLLQHHQKDSSTFHVDSAMRDKRFYPLANEYAVTFEEPFRMVYGFDILDASLPNVMYNVDVHNNRLVYAQVTPAAAAGEDLQVAYRRLQEVADYRARMEAVEASDVFLCRQSHVDAVPPQFLQPPPAAPECYVYARRVVAGVAYQADDDRRGDAAVFAHVTVGTRLYALRRADCTADVLAAIEDERVFLELGANGVGQLHVFEELAVSADVRDYLVGGELYDFRVTTHVESLITGSYDINTLFLEVARVMGNTNIALTAPLDTTVLKSSKYQYNGTNDFYLDMRRSTVDELLGFTTPAMASEASLYRALTFGDNLFLFRSAYDAVLGQYRLVQPGVINVTGTRYLILRCKELEDHLSTNNAVGSNTPGIGIFKMAGGNDITHLRFDFVNLVRKPFHPIGRLTRLTIRFQTREGELYDFKGVDHQMLMMVKYYAPDVQPTFRGSVLNPQYTPDFMEYMIRHMRRHKLLPPSDEEDSSSSDESGDDGESERGRGQNAVDRRNIWEQCIR